MPPSSSLGRKILSTTSSRAANQQPTVRPSGAMLLPGFSIQEPFPDQELEQRLAGHRIDVPEARGLLDGQLQAGHFAVLTTNTRDQRVDRRHAINLARALVLNTTAKSSWVASA